MKVLVTGSSGFLGSALVKYLLDRDHDIVGFSTMPGQSGVVGDITDYDTVVRAVKDVDFIFHLAGVANVSECTKYPERAMLVNAEGTNNILRAVREHNPDVHGMLLSSSIKVYGIQNVPRVTEDMKVNPDSVYAKSKLKAEEYCMEASIPTVIFRQSNIYGPKQSPEYVISSILQQAIRGNVIKLRNAGAAADFLYINDILRAYEMAMLNPSKGIYNVCSGNVTCLEEIVDIVSKKLRKKLDVKSDNYQKLDEPVFDRSKFTKRYKWKPLIDIDSGISKTIESLLASS